MSTVEMVVPEVVISGVLPDGRAFRAGGNRPAPEVAFLPDCQPEKAGRLLSTASSKCRRALATVATAVLGVMPVAVRPTTPQSTTVPAEWSVDIGVPALQLPPAESQECPDTDPRAIATADKLMATGPPIRLEQLNSKYIRESLEAGKSKKASYRNAIIDAGDIVEHETAFELGLHLFDADIADLNADLYPPAVSKVGTGPFALERTVERAQLPFSVYLERAQSFLAQYDMDIVIEDPSHIYSHGLRGPTQEDLETFQAKEWLLDIIKVVESNPRELIELIGLKHIKMGVINPDIKKSAGYPLAMASMSPTHDVITVNVSVASSRGGLAHEMGHIMDAAVCGSPGAGVDYAFTSLNSGEGYDQKKVEGTSKLPFVRIEVSELHNQSYSAKLAGDAALSEELDRRAKELSKKIAFVSNAPNALEDKADTISYLLQLHRYEEVVNGEPNLLEAKFILQFARIFQHNPALGIWYAMNSKRPAREFGSNPALAKLYEGYAPWQSPAVDYATNKNNEWFSRQS